MPRRIPDFPDSFYSWNLLSSVGSGVTLLSLVVFLLLLIHSLVSYLLLLLLFVCLCYMNYNWRWYMFWRVRIQQVPDGGFHGSHYRPHETEFNVSVNISFFSVFWFSWLITFCHLFGEVCVSAFQFLKSFSLSLISLPWFIRITRGGSWWLSREKVCRERNIIQQFISYFIFIISISFRIQYLLEFYFIFIINY